MVRAFGREPPLSIGVRFLTKLSSCCYMDSIVQDKLASLLDEKKSLTAQLLKMPEWEERKAYRGVSL